MGEELEVVAAASLGGLASGDHHPVEPGKPCGNCGTVVEQRYCPRCGQLGSDFHRPFFSLVVSSISDTFALDGRLWRSIPMLLFRPGRLTRNYLDGMRARYVPPFRMFLLASVLFFLTIFGLGSQMGWYHDIKLGNGDSYYIGVAGQESIPLTSEERIASLEKAAADPTLPPDEIARVEAELTRVRAGILLDQILKDDNTFDREALKRIVDEKLGEDATEAEKTRLYQSIERAARWYENQDVFGQRLREWAPRFSLMFMPILALMLTLSYAWRRKLFIYDHVITALHFQTFLYVLLTVLVLFGAFTPAGVSWAILVGYLAVTAYMYRMLRVTYSTGRVMSALRVVLLQFAGITAVSALAVSLVVISFFLT